MYRLVPRYTLLVAVTQELRLPRHSVLSIVLALALMAGWTVSSLAKAGSYPGLRVGATPVDLPALPNVVRLAERLYSGGLPGGEPGFRTLQRLGIRTLITVDGARPDVATAKRYGMRYVHLPFGYDGLPIPTANAIV